MKMMTLTDRNYDKFIKDGEKVVIYTTGYCRKCKAAIEKAEATFPQSGIVELSDPRCVGITTKIKLMKVPTMVIFRNGKEIKRAEGTTALFNLIDQA